WDMERTQEVIYTDYLATVKRDADIARLTNRLIEPITNEMMGAEILRQNRLPDLHKQYILALEHELHSAINTDSKIKPMRLDWAPLRQKGTLEILRRGAS